MHRETDIYTQVQTARQTDRDMADTNKQSDNKQTTTRNKSNNDNNNN